MSEIARQQGGTLKTFLQQPQVKEQIARALPRHLDPDRMVRIATTALLRNPKLQDCTQESFVSCLLHCSAMGLEPDGHRAHLIPFRNNKAGTTICTMILDYKGIVELALRNGDIDKIHADVVCENDEFEENLGEIVHHKIDRRKPRGKVYAAYAMVWRKNGSRQAVVMSLDEIEAIRRKSRSANDGPWVDHWNEMAKKTVFKRLAKWITLSPEIRDQLQREDEFEEEARHEEITVKTRPISQASAILEALDGPSPEDTAGLIEHQFHAAELFAKLRTIETIDARLLDLQANGGYTEDQQRLLHEAAEVRRQQLK
jgi:recombination protein RecT